MVRPIAHIPWVFKTCYESADLPLLLSWAFCARATTYMRKWGCYVAAGPTTSVLSTQFVITVYTKPVFKQVQRNTCIQASTQGTD